jgi:hypothetical protein
MFTGRVVGAPTTTAAKLPISCLALATPPPRQQRLAGDSATGRTGISPHDVSPAGKSDRQAASPSMLHPTLRAFLTTAAQASARSARPQSLSAWPYSQMRGIFPVRERRTRPRRERFSHLHSFLLAAFQTHEPLHVSHRIHSCPSMHRKRPACLHEAIVRCPRVSRVGGDASAQSTTL